MADNLTDEAERLILDWLDGLPVTQPTPPLVIRLMTANGTDSAAGTEVTGDLYDEQAIGFGGAATAAGVSSKTNPATVTFPTLDSTAAKSITGFEIWDSAATPIRIAHHAFAAPVNIPAGQPATFDPNTLTLTAG